MSKAKFEAAKQLIQEGNYPKARALLKTIDHPRADEWLQKLDQLEKKKPKPSTQPQRKPESQARRKAGTSTTPPPRKSNASSVKAPGKRPTPATATQGSRGGVLRRVLLLLVMIALVIAGVLVIPPLLNGDDDDPEATPAQIAQVETTDEPAETETPQENPDDGGDTDDQNGDAEIEGEDEEAIPTNIPTEEVDDPANTPTPASSPTPAPAIALNQILGEQPDVITVMGLSVQAGNVDTFGFAFLVTTQLEVIAGRNTQETAEALRLVMIEALETDAINVNITLNDNLSTATNYEWTNRAGEWTSSRAFTSDVLNEAFLDVAGVEFAEALSVSTGDLETTGFEVFVTAQLVVEPGFNTLEMAQTILEAIYTAYETEDVRLSLVLVDNVLAPRRYEWSNNSQTWQQFDT